MVRGASRPGSTPPGPGGKPQPAKVIVIESFSFSAAEQRAISTALTTGPQGRPIMGGAARIERPESPPSK
jgi:hypothetical protein